MANENRQKTEYEDAPFNTRTMLTGLWIAMILFYIYCDHFSIFRPGEIERVMSGFIGPFKITQLSLVLASLTTILPSLIIVACLFLKPKYLKWINIVGGILFMLVNIGNLVGETWAYYWVYGVIEFLITVAIVIKSIKWPRVK